MQTAEDMEITQNPIEAPLPKMAETEPLIISPQLKTEENDQVDVKAVATTTMPVKNNKTARKDDGGLIAAINRPWLLIMIPVLLGGLWLVNNTWIITNNLDKPYALLAGPVAVISILAGWLVFKFFQTIEAWCKQAYQAFFRARKEDGSAQFFWLVIIVFMVVSVFASGSFFSLLEHNVLPGLGYATALFIDLVAVQSMRARLNAVRMRDTKGANLYLFGVLICAGASAFANVYISLAHFQETVTGVLPLWMLSVAPWFGLVFPALILLLSMTADYTLDQISTRLDPEKYKEQEEKRMKLLEIQRDMLKRRVAIEGEIDTLSLKRQRNKEKRVFFLINWLFPLRQIPQQSIDTHIIVDEVVEHIRPWFQFLDTKAFAIQQAQGSSILELQKHNSVIESDIQMMLGEFQTLKRSLTLLENSLSAVSSVRNEVGNDTDSKDLAEEQDALTPSILQVGSDDMHQEVFPVILTQSDEDLEANNDDEQNVQHTEELHIFEGLFAQAIADREVKNNDQSFSHDREEIEELLQKYREHAVSESEQEESDLGNATEIGEHSREEVQQKFFHGPYSIKIEEVAEKFDTTIHAVEEAIKNGQLKRAKRGHNKVLISSLQKFSPPRKRRRRAKSEQSSEMITV